MDNYLHRTFHALGDATRLSVVEQLLGGPASVSELAEPHEMALPAFTKHLRVLEGVGLIRSEKTGRVRTCFIHPPALRELHGWFSQRQDMWEARLDNLAAYLEDNRKGQCSGNSSRNTGF
ncbi:MAG: metalloregulator ArsR/SmtB family transcription factor [Pseudomonadota bacterium]